MHNYKIILASASKGRLGLLKTIGITPDQLLPMDIDETEKPKELPRDVALRLATEKAIAAAEKVSDGVIIAADTVTCVGRKILPKALDDNMVRSCLKAMSGRRHKVFSGLAVILKENNIIKKHSSKVVESIIKYKRLTDEEISFYLATNEGVGKSGGTTIQGFSQIFIEWMSGSYSNIIGLPLYELYIILNGFGIKMKDLTKAESVN
ncbi:MAG: maf [Rickettsiaceae bacterium]|jgi:septum formation protein|nr:maf [Rickettsiaceae bacterium]